MSMLPENHYCHYNRINQSCDKIVMPLTVLHYLFPEESVSQNIDDEYINNSELLLFKIKSFSVGNQQDINIDNKTICSLDTFLDVEEVYVTDNIFQKLGLEIYTSCNFEKIEETLPKGEGIVLSPLQKEFMIIKTRNHYYQN